MAKKTKSKNTKKATKQKPNNHSFYIKLLWGMLIAGLILVTCIFIFISKTQLPDTSVLEDPDYEIATRILADDGRELGKAFKLNREWLSYEEINPLIIDALVSTEDVRFFNHSGIDARGTVRAVAYLSTRGGASTITQQLAKLFFTVRSRTFVKRIWQKLKEWVIAIEFEKRYTKEEILAMYLNKYDFLFGANGVSAAAKTYFGKDQSKLKVEEAAVLVGLLKNPWIYNPKQFPENANKRRAVVLKQMVRNNKLSDKKYKILLKQPIDVSNFKRENNFSGIAPYFKAELVKSVKSILKKDKYAKPDGTKYDLYTDGLVIKTTIDYDMQKHAENAMHKHMSSLQKLYFEKWKGQDPWTYKADDAQKRKRRGTLSRQIRETDRFKNLRRRYIGKISNEISENIKNVRLLDTDIFRLFNEDKKPGSLANLVRKNTIRRDQSKTYKEILKSKYWKTLKKQWLLLQKKKDKVFSKKVKMKIFAYNSLGEKTVEMSPLDSIRYHHMHLQLGSVSVDPKSGYIKTWVGGVNHKYFKYDHIRSNRQVGSTFKPFIYATAIDDLAISPCQKVKDQQYSIPAGGPKFNLMKSWSPTNANNKFSNQNLTLKEALKKSKNSVSVFLMKEIGNTERVRNFASKMGIPKSKIPSAPSICLGVPELSVMDMAGAYTTFANNGIHTTPLSIKTIEDANGRVIYSGVQHRKRAINASINYVMVDMLKYAASFISGPFKSELGGKTGTTNDYKDGWFMGLTPDLVIATWVGGDNEWIRFKSLQNGQGGVMARPFCLDFLKRLENDPNSNYDYNAKYSIPENLNVELDCSLYEAMEQDDIKKSEAIKKEKEDSLDDEFEEDF
ncbi:MAG: transglycosylase domain-containing protein [Saprospiraceae bacterium]